MTFFKMGTKRSHVNIDPDYEDVTEHHNKRQRLLEEDAKETTRKKIENIVCNQFVVEEMEKERELEIVDQRLNQARVMMDRLRACVVANFYNTAGQQKMFQNKPSTQTQPAIHPTVQEHLGKKPKCVESSSSSDNAVQVPTVPKKQYVTSIKLESRASLDLNKEKKEEIVNQSHMVQIDQSTSRTARYKMKKRIIVGNVSKYIPVDKREENDQSTHKWMVYVRGSKDEPKIDHYVKKVWFFLHPSYRPNDLVEVSQPPFHLTRRGWGEFPVRIQLHFCNQRNKRVDIIHPLKLDRTYTGLQTLGSETIVDIELEKEKTVISSLPVSLTMETLSKAGGKDGLRTKADLMDERNITIVEQTTPKKHIDSELKRRMIPGEVTPINKIINQGEVTPSNKILFQGEVTPLTKRNMVSSYKAHAVPVLGQQSSIVCKDIEYGFDSIQDNSNLSNKENYCHGDDKPASLPDSEHVNSRIELTSGKNVQQNLKNMNQTHLKSGIMSSVSLVPKSSSSIIKSQGASYSSVATPSGVITVNKINTSGSASLAPSSSNVQLVLGGFGSLTNPSSTEIKPSVISGGLGLVVNQGDTVNKPAVTVNKPAIAVNKPAIIVGENSTSSLLSSGSPSSSHATITMKSGSQNVIRKTTSASPARNTTNQNSSTVILQGMGSLSKTALSSGGPAKNVKTQNIPQGISNLSLSSPGSGKGSLIQSTSAQVSGQNVNSVNPLSNPSSLYIRCRDNQGNIFLVPQHLLKQFTQTPTEKSHSSATVTTVSSQPCITQLSDTVAPSRTIVVPSGTETSVVSSQLSGGQIVKQVIPNVCDTNTTSLSTSVNLTESHGNLHNNIMSTTQGNSPRVCTTENVSSCSSESVTSIQKCTITANSHSQTAQSGQVQMVQNQFHIKSPSPVKSEPSSSLASKNNTPQKVVMKFPQTDDLNYPAGGSTSLLNSSQTISGSMNIPPTSPRSQLKVTSQGLKIIQASPDGLVQNMEKSNSVTKNLSQSLLKPNVKKNVTVSAILKENAVQNRHSVGKTSGISSTQSTSNEQNDGVKLVAIATNSDSKTPMLVLTPQDKKLSQSVSQDLGSKLKTPEKETKQSASYNIVLSNAADGSKCLSLLANTNIINKGIVQSQSHSVTSSNSLYVNTSKTPQTSVSTGTMLTAKGHGQPVTLNLSQVQSSAKNNTGLTPGQSKTVLATIGNQTLLLQLPVSEVKTSTVSSILKGNKGHMSQSVAMETTLSSLSKQSSNIANKANGKCVQVYPGEKYEPVLSSSEKTDKQIFVWKKKKCYETAPVPPKEILPIRVDDFPDLISVIRAAVKRHPVVSMETDFSQHPYCARTVEDWLSWNVGKRRSSEWQRALTVRRFIKQQLGGADTYKGTQLWTTKQIMIWCRHHAYSPHYLEKMLHPTALELSADSNTMGKVYSSATDATDVLLKLHEDHNRSDDISDDEIDIIGIDPPTVKVKVEPTDTHICDNPVILPPSDEAVFIQDTGLKIGVKFEPSEVVPKVYSSTSEDLIFNAMESFISELLTETFALKVNMGRYPDGLGVGDVYKALTTMSKADFTTSKHLGVKDITTNTVHR